jgi:hypothetical protein
VYFLLKFGWNSTLHLWTLTEPTATGLLDLAVVELLQGTWLGYDVAPTWLHTSVICIQSNEMLAYVCLPVSRSEKAQRMTSRAQKN